MENHCAAFIQRIGKRLFGEKPTAIIDAPSSSEEDIPRYPPFMKGLPAASVDRILATQTELIKAIEQALSLPDGLYQTIAAPVIARYAAFSHLLPASESHHHRGAGGLFRHGLEVAHWATMASQGCLFATDATPRERKALELRWRLAVCFAGLLHDVGKPVSDMAVVDSQGQYTWNPCDENLTDWAARHQIDRYFLRWRENRHKRHEQFSALVIERVLTRESRTFILEPGPDIMQAMLETIHGLDRGAKLSELVIMADCRSVERDLKARYHGIDSAMGMPVEKYLFDAMRRLIKNGQWLINEKGARLWRFQEGLHIVWRTGAQDIVTTLTKDKVPGIPRDEDTLADILIERGLAIPKVSADGRQFRYWRMKPVGLDAPLYMLRLASIELIFSNEPPVAVEATEIADNTESDNEPTKPPSPHHQSTTPNQHADLVVESRTDDGDSRDATTSAPSDASLASPIPQASTELDNAVATAFPEPESQATRVKVKTQPASNANPTATEPGLSIASEIVSTQASKIEDGREIAKTWLREQGQAGQWLIEIGNKINQGQWQYGVDLLAVRDKCLLAFPSTSEKLQVEPNTFIKTLAEKGWLVTDVLSPMRKVQTIGQMRGLLLAPEPTGKMQQLISKQAAPHEAARQPVNQSKEANTQSQNPEKLVVNSQPQARQQKKKKDDEPSRNQNPLPAIAPTSTTRRIDSEPKQPESTPKQNRSDINSKNNSDAKTHQSPEAEPHTTGNVSQSTSDKTLFYPEEINQWIREVRLTNSQSDTKSANSRWYFVSDAELLAYLEEHPELQRYDFFRDIGLHTECRVIGRGQGVKVRIEP